MILIKYATRGRAEWFKKAISNITATISTQDYMILVSTDLDDPEMNSPSIIKWCSSHDKIMLVGGKSSSKIEAINRDMEFAEKLNWDILVCMSDDMHFSVRGWDSIIHQRMNDNFPDGDCFLHFNDGYVKDALATMSIMDRKYYERDGYIYHPAYKSFSCDAEAYYVALMRGRHMYFDEILALHQHPSNSKIPNDRTYITNAGHTDHDTKVYFERLKRYFDEPAGHDILRARPELKRYL